MMNDENATLVGSYKLKIDYLLKTYHSTGEKILNLSNYSNIRLTPVKKK